MQADKGSELAQARCAAHAAFDPVWKDGAVSRTQAYKWLGRKLGLGKDNTHIGMFDVQTCAKVVELCKFTVFDAFKDLDLEELE